MRDADAAMELRDPLAELLGALPAGGRFRYTYDDAVKLAGHSCPTIVGAWLATAAALDALYPESPPVRGDIEVVLGADREDPAAGPMSQVISLVTGAAPETGFGGLGRRFRRRGLLRFDAALAGRIHFRRRDTGAAVEVTWVPEALPPSRELQELLPRIIADEVGTGERKRFAALWVERVRELLAGDRDRVVHVHRVGAPLATEPLEIRAHSLADHQALRRAAARLRERVQGCDCAALPYATGEAIATLLDMLRAHLDDEDATLGPILQHIDPWGPVRAAQHEERRRVERARIAELLARLADPLRDGPLREHVLRFVDWLEGDLTAEEERDLGERLLSEDPIVGDAFTG